LKKILTATMTASKTIPPKTFLPQKALIFKDMQPIHIWMFMVGLIGSNWYLHQFVWADPVVLPLEERLDPTANPVFRTFLLTSVLNLALLPSLAFLTVMVATKNNSFSNNPEDFNTGALNVRPANHETDPDHQRANNIHRNALENVPLAVLCNLIMILSGYDTQAATFYMWTFPMVRSAHFVWYWNAGSHELRAALFSMGVFCNIGCMFQVLKVCGVV
jgi:glutathione S-transferase